MKKDKWQDIEVGDTFVKGDTATKYKVIAICGEVVCVTTTSVENKNNSSSLTWYCTQHFFQQGWRVIGGEWEKTEDAIEYLKSKGMIRDGKVITS